MRRFQVQDKTPEESTLLFGGKKETFFRKQLNEPLKADINRSNPFNRINPDSDYYARFRKLSKSNRAVLSSGVCAANAIKSLKIFRIWTGKYICKLKY
jgi:hypothetical protein